MNLEKWWCTQFSTTPQNFIYISHSLAAPSFLKMFHQIYLGTVSFNVDQPWGHNFLFSFLSLLQLYLFKTIYSSNLLSQLHLAISYDVLKKTQPAGSKTAPGHFAKKTSCRSRKPPNPCPTHTQGHHSL